MMEINLLPPTDHFAGTKRSAEWVILCGAVIVAVAMSVVGWSQRQAADASRATLQNLNVQVQQLQAQLSSLQNPSTPLAPAVPDLSNLVAGVQEVSPYGVTIVSVGWQNGQVSIAGNTDTLEHLAAYETALAKLPECASVWVDSVTATTDHGYIYTIHVNWKAGVQ